MTDVTQLRGYLGKLRDGLDGSFKKRAGKIFHMDQFFGPRECQFFFLRGKIQHVTSLINFNCCHATVIFFTSFKTSTVDLFFKVTFVNFQILAQKFGFTFPKTFSLVKDSNDLK